MKAIVINKFGDPDVFERVQLDKPSADDGEVLIEVRATSVNPVDWKMRNGFGSFLVPEFPAVLHPDCSGIVVEVGENVSNFSVGDEVYCFATGLMGKQGALAEYMAADARMVAHKPKNMTFEEAATLPLVWVTACFVLLDRIKIESGSSLLIQGGTGGVGFVALQLAAAKLDVKLYATCGSDEKCRIAEALGAKKAFNYNTSSVSEMVEEATNGSGFDVIFNAPGAEAINASVEAAGFGGTILDINGTFPTEGNFQGKQLGFVSVFAGHPITHGFNQEKVGLFLQDLTTLVESGQVKTLIDEKRFTFANIQEAHEYQENGKPVGKVSVSTIWE